MIRRFSVAAVAISLLSGIWAGLGTAASASPRSAPTAVHIHVTGFASELWINGKIQPLVANERFADGPSSILSFGPHAFTPQHPYWAFADSDGHGAEQICYSKCSTLSEQWGYKLSALARSTVSGDVAEDANLFCGTTHLRNYGTHVAIPSYQFHGSKTKVNTRCNYHTILAAAWEVKGGGHALLQARWSWYVTLV